MRHSWEEMLRVPNKTERVCRHCGMIKVTRHEPSEFPPHWIEFWRPRAGDLPERLPDDKTPACEPAKPKGAPVSLSAEGRERGPRDSAVGGSA